MVRAEAWVGHREQTAPLGPAGKETPCSPRPGSFLTSGERRRAMRDRRRDKCARAVYRNNGVTRVTSFTILVIGN